MGAFGTSFRGSTSLLKPSHLSILKSLEELKIPFVASGGFLALALGASTLQGTATGVQLAAALAMGSSESKSSSKVRSNAHNASHNAGVLKSLKMS